MFLQWVARHPDPSRKRCYAGVLLGAHIHTVALTTVSNCDKFVMVHYTCLVQGTNFCRCHLIRHTSLRWAPFLCIGTGICARFSVLFRFILQRRAVGLRARCNAFALPSLACPECMHSNTAPGSRAACLRARYNAFAAKFRRIQVHVQHYGSWKPCCVPAGTVQCIRTD